MEKDNNSKRKADADHDGAETKKPKAERTCHACNKVKGEDEFSKNQRSKGDLARCKACVASTAPSASPSAAPSAAQTLKCCKCLDNKSVEHFSKKARKKGADAKCNKCFTEERRAEERKRQAEREAELREQRQKHEAARKAAEEAWQESIGPQVKMPTFEVPGFVPGWVASRREDDYRYRCPDMAFKEEGTTTTLESLVGSYDLVFYYNSGFTDGEDHNRATKGSLEFTMEDNGEEKKLHGLISIDKSVMKDMWHHRDDVKITCDSKSGASSFQVTNLDEIENFCGDDEDGVGGTIERVAQRRAVRYSPEAAFITKDYQHDYAQSIEFENAEEAKTILDNHPQPLMWLVNHKEVPAEVSRRVQEFASSKPPPIFFFEEDDLLLTFNWDTDYREPYSTHLVARRRVAASF